MTEVSHTFASKTWGGIFVMKEEDIPTVIETIKEVDPYEFSCYFPEDLVRVFSPGATVTYTHKFEIDIAKLMVACFAKGLAIWCVTGWDDWDTLPEIPEKKEL